MGEELLPTGLSNPKASATRPQRAEILLPELGGRGRTAPPAPEPALPGLCDGEASALGSWQGRPGTSRHGYLHDHLHGRQRRCDVLWMWGADGYWHTAGVEAAVKRCDEVYS